MKKLSLFLFLTTFLLTSSLHSGDRVVNKNNFYLSDPDYYVLRGKAVADNKPLCVWVKSIPRRFAGYFHWETDEDTWFGVSGAGLVVGVPYKGDLYCVRLPYTSTKAAIDEAVKTNLEKWSKITPTSYETFSGADCPT